MSNEAVEMRPIACIHTPYSQKFGVPRQPGLVSAARGRIELLPPYNRPEAVDGLAGFSHLWVLFWFHQAQREQWKPTVRPPRLGGNQRVGVFASRSPFRPNPIGLSVLRLLEVSARPGRVELMVEGMDLVDGTPILDIKPYVPYVDSVTDATDGFAVGEPERLPVRWSAEAVRQLATLADAATLRALAEQVLAQDPRPAYRRDEREYGVELAGCNLRFRIREGVAEVLAVARISSD